MKLASILALTSALALLSARALAADLVVDDNGGPGVDHTDIQPAVNAASPGDRILVMNGSYGSFVVAGKSLTIEGQGPGTLIQGTIRLRQLAADAPLRMAGLRCVAAQYATALIVRNNQAPVRIEDCTFEGYDGAGGECGVYAAFVRDCAALLLERCVLLGGNGGYGNWSCCMTLAEPGGVGLVAHDSNLHVIDTALSGGHGGNVVDDEADDGARGGDGASVFRSFLFTSGSSYTGGNGGYGGPYDCDPLGGCGYGYGGCGGDGLLMRGTETVRVEHTACSFTGGTGGSSASGPGYEGWDGGGLVSWCSGCQVADWNGPAVALCFGDGSGASCPCDNWGLGGEGCANSTGTAAILAAGDLDSRIANFDDLVFHVAQAPPNRVGLLLQAENLIATPFADGILCSGNPTRRIEFLQLDGLGAGSTSLSVVERGHVHPGQTRIYQFWYRDGPGPCGGGSNLTNAAQVDWL